MLYIGRIGGNAVVMGEDDEGGKGGERCGYDRHK
jgi:hypothetical protein